MENIKTVQIATNASRAMLVALDVKIAIVIVWNASLDWFSKAVLAKLPAVRHIPLTLLEHV